MLSTNFISVIVFQLKFEIICSSNKDSLVLNKNYYKQIDKCIEIIRNLNPDICVFPEMSYQERYDDIFKELSKDDKIIIFGSSYDNRINKTKIFNNANLVEVVKRYPCGSEPMTRIYERITVEDFIANYLKEHEFYIKGEKIYILNCLEYYKVAYMIARNEKLSKNLFGFIVPCSNSNPNVFIDESRAIHNHNENIYSFVCNRIKGNGKEGYGRSYIFGPIQYHEKEWLSEESIVSENHNSSILTLDSFTPSYVYGKYAIPNTVSRFGRSDLYINTPREIKVESLI